MTIALTPELEAALAHYSQQRGLTPDELAQQLLRDKLNELEQAASPAVTASDVFPESEGTLADLFAGRIGVVSGKGIVSARNTGQQFTEILLQKRREGKL
jgi:hypothetical protein